MTPISQTLMDMLTRQGISAGPGATSRAHGMKGARRGQDGAAGQVMADAAGGEPHRPTAGGGIQPMRNSGKGRGPKPAPVNREVGVKQTGEATLQTLHVVVDNSRCKPIHTPTRVAPRGIGFHLVLIEGGRK